MLATLRHKTNAYLACLVAMTGCGSGSSENTADASVQADAPRNQDAAPNPDAANDATPLASPFTPFGTVTVSFDFQVDGIASTQLALPAYPGGLFAMMNSDGNAAAVGWDEIIAATGLYCDP